MKRKVLLLTAAIILLRIINIFYLNMDPLFYLSPRNFNGRGLLTIPGWLDFIIPVVVILVLRGRDIRFQFSSKNILKPLLVAFSILLTPIITCLLLNNYIQKSLIFFDINSAFVFRYLLFIVSFIAINVFADSVRFNKKYQEILFCF